MVTTIELSQSITEKQYHKVVEVLKELGISVKTDDTKLTKSQMLEKIEKSRRQIKNQQVTKLSDYKSFNELVESL